MPPRFHCPSLTRHVLPDLEPDPQPAAADPCMLDESESHHAHRVLRLSAGDAVELFDGRGHTAAAEITRADRKGVWCSPGPVTFTPAPGPTLTLATALPKGSRAEDLINQLAQLGVDQVIPLRCDHGVVEAGANKLERLEKAALAAAKQCGRAHAMAIGSPIPFDEALKRAAAADLARLLAPGGPPWPPQALGQALAAAAGVWVLVGPEGGWSEAETAAAATAGIAPWSLNPHVLRIETAAAAAAAVVRHAGPH